MSSFQEALQKRGKKRKFEAIKEAFNIIRASDVMVFDVNFPEEFSPEMESLFILKFTEHGYKRWLDLVAAIPSATIAVMRPVLKKYLSAVCRSDLSDDEVDRWFRLTKTLLSYKQNDHDMTANTIIEAGSVIGIPFTHVVAPPLEKCVKCDGNLTMHNQPSHATIFDTDGPHPAIKISLKCRRCAPNVNYSYAKYGNTEQGYKFYEGKRKLVEASSETYVSRSLARFHIYLA